jgi:hypothetical protein
MAPSDGASREDNGEGPLLGTIDETIESDRFSFGAGAGVAF